MSAKLLHDLTEDNPDLQKQIGCMTGNFQNFDGQIVATARRITNHSHKRILADHSRLNSGNPGGDTNNGRYTSNSGSERQRVPAESSRTSISSSSSSSSFSSVNCKKTVRTEIPREGNIFSETSSAQLRNIQQNASPAVKDSIYKEARVVPAKAMTKDESMNHVGKHRSSVRPFQLSESTDGSYKVGNYGMSGVPADFSESLRILSKLREGRGSLSDTKDPPRSSYEGRHGSSFSVPKDAPRFSYDGQEMPRVTFESRSSFMSNTKIKELPRLSLDSREEGSMKRTNRGPNSNSSVTDSQRDTGKSKVAQTPLQEAGMHGQPRHSNVVAKLMGLELMPTSQIATESQRPAKAYTDRDIDSFSRPSECKQNRAPCSPRSLFKEPTSPRSRNPTLIMKPILSTPVPMEPAPWRQADGTRGVGRPAGRNLGKPLSSSLITHSAYGNIERRLRELEFRQLDDDLRTLTHMLDTMQETQRGEDRASNFELESNYNKPNHSGIDHRRTPENIRPISATFKASSPAETPIVIMKPAKSARTAVNKTNGISTPQKLLNGDSLDCGKGAVNGRVVKKLRPKVSLREPVQGRDSDNGKKANAVTSNSAKTPTGSQQLPREKILSSTRSSGSASPKIHQRIPRPERQAGPPSDLSITKKQSVRKSGSSHGKRRPKSPNMRQMDDNISETRSGSSHGRRRPKSPNMRQMDDNTSETRSLSYQGDEISLRSDSNISSASQMDVEVTSADRSGEVNGMFILQDSSSRSAKVPNNFSSPPVERKKQSYGLRDDARLAEPMAVTPEQPSPISVLDASLYRDDLSSPDEKTPNPDEYPVKEQLSTDLDHLRRGGKKLENVEHLVQKLRRLNSTHDESKTDYIASLCENNNPDHRYVSEILLASGLLLGDLESGLMSFHPSGHPINPDLFYVLEQTKTSSNYLTGTNRGCEEASKSDQQEKLHRKLVFDSVNEILEHKLHSVGPLLNPWLQSSKLAGRSLNAQRLLRDLCSEIEKLVRVSENSPECLFDGEYFLTNILFEDVISVSQNWAVCNGEVSEVVLGVERLMFKDLIDEVVNNEVIILASAKQSRRRCRQLFRNAGV